EAGKWWSIMVNCMAGAIGGPPRSRGPRREQIAGPAQTFLAGIAGASSCLLPGVGFVGGRLAAGQRDKLVDIWRHHGRPSTKFDHGLLSLLIHQPVAAGCHHYRVDHQDGWWLIIEPGGNRFDNLYGA